MVSILLSKWICKKYLHKNIMDMIKVSTGVNISTFLIGWGCGSQNGPSNWQKGHGLVNICLHVILEAFLHPLRKSYLHSEHNKILMTCCVEIYNRVSPWVLQFGVDMKYFIIHTQVLYQWATIEKYLNKYSTATLDWSTMQRICCRGLTKSAFRFWTGWATTATTDVLLGKKVTHYLAG